MQCFGYNNNMKKITIAILFLLLIAGSFWFFKNGRDISIIKDTLNGSAVIRSVDNKENIGQPASAEATAGKQNNLNGVVCENYDRRPFAVMYAGDAIARPLSGIASADLVVEAQVISGSITRMMALFVCDNPAQIGSIRSARHDFIPLAQGFDAIYVHWGGSHFALDVLRQKIIDNLDALRNPYSVFYRDESIPAPHNGFTSMERMTDASQKLDYRMKSEFEGYKFYSEDEIKSEVAKSDSCASDKKYCSLDIFYAGIYKVSYDYDFENNSYSRKRGGTAEIDKLSGEKVAVKNIVVMAAKSKQIEGQYNDIDAEGKGKATIYQNGREIKGAWQKDELNKQSKLTFFDESSEEIKFTPGKIWIEIVDPNQTVKWE